MRHLELPIRLMQDGNQWCALIGTNLQEGIAGFGKEPWLALTSLCGELVEMGDDNVVNHIHYPVEVGGDRCWCGHDFRNVGRHQIVGDTRQQFVVWTEPATEKKGGAK